MVSDPPEEFFPPGDDSSTGLTARPGPGGWPDIGYLFSLADTALMTAMSHGAQVALDSGGNDSPSGQSAPFSPFIMVRVLYSECMLGEYMIQSPP